MSSEYNFLDYFFGGIIANLPLWVFSLFFIVSPSLISLIILTILGIIGGAIAGYLMKYKTEEIHKWSPTITGSLAFFASILILGDMAPTLTDFILLPAFISGVYIGFTIYRKYPIKRPNKVIPHQQ